MRSSARAGRAAAAAAAVAAMASPPRPAAALHPPAAAAAAAAAGGRGHATGAAGGCAATVSTQQDSEFAQRRLRADTVDLAAGQPGPKLLRGALDAVAAAAAHRLSGPAADPFLLQYGPEQGYESFRRALAAFVARETGCPVDPEELLITAGVSHGLDLACRFLAAPGDAVIVEQPTYFLAGPILRQAGLQLLPVPLGDGGMDLDALEALLQQRAAQELAAPRLCYTIPVHNNPTGATLSLPQRRRLLALIHEHGVAALVADEVYQLLTFPGAQPPAPPPPLRAVERQMLEQGLLGGPPGGGSGDGSSGSSRVVSLGSFSKILAPGLRLGWAEAAPQLLKQLRRDGVLGSGGSIAPLASGVAHSALELGLLQSCLHGAIRPALAARCDALCDALRQHLPDASFVQPSGGYFVWLELPCSVCTKELLVLAARDFGVRFAPGALADGQPHCARLSFAFYEPDELREGVARLARALAAYQAGER